MDKNDTEKQLIEAGYTKQEVADIMGIGINEIDAGLAMDLGLTDPYLYGELVKFAERAGLDVESYAYRSVRRVLEKVSGGMNFAAACERAGLSLDFVMACVEKDEGLKDLFYASQHKFDMKAMGSMMQALERGDGKLALEVLGRQSKDFKPAKQVVEVSKTVDIRKGQVIDV